MGTGFDKDLLRARYDVSSFDEDNWHRHSTQTTKLLLSRHIPPGEGGRLLNAGAGVYSLGLAGYEEFLIDLFAAPIEHKPRATIGSIESMPFPDAMFDVVVCVGEVLSYCDPAKAVRELARVLKSPGLLVLDFGSTASFRQIGTSRYRKAAALFTDTYNGSDEKVWIYSPRYIASLLENHGFSLRARHDSHVWSSLTVRLGLSMSGSIRIENALGRVASPRGFGDVVTYFAEK